MAQTTDARIPFSSVQTLINEGDSLYRAFDNEAALARYEQAAATNPGDFPILIRMIRTLNDRTKDLLAKQEKRQAETLMNRAVALVDTMEARFPDRRETYFFLAATYGTFALFKGGKQKVRLGRNVERYARRSIEIDSTYALPYIALGIFNREVAGLNWIQRTFAKILFGGVPHGSREDAVAYFQHAIRLDPSINLAHFELAQTYHAMKRDEEAVRELELVIRLAPYTTQDLRNISEAPILIKKWSK